jgi:hypothetical protein
MAYTINDIRAVDRPQKAYEFEVEILGSTISGQLPLLTTRVENAAIPEVALEPITINYKGRKSIYSGRDASPHTISITFWDDESRATYKFMKSWINGALDETLGGGATRDLLATEMLIKMFAADSQTQTSTTRLTKVWPQSVGEITLNYTDSAHVTFTCIFSYDENKFEQ